MWRRLILLCLLVGLWTIVGLAQGGDKGGGARTAPANGKRLALVVGNAAYVQRPLSNPVNDARAMAQVLRECGFEVLTGFDLSKAELEQKILQFGEKLKASQGVGLFYYSGHGIQVDGENFLIPVEFDINRVPDRRLTKNHATNVDEVLAYMDLAGNGLNIVILDACRDNPFEKGWKSVKSKGLAGIDAPSGTFIAYATAPNRTATDGTERNSPYTAALLKQLKIPGQSIYDVFDKVGAEVEDTTGRAQKPWIASSLRGRRFCFQGCEDISDSAPPPPRKPANINLSGVWETATFNYEQNKTFTIEEGGIKFVTAWSACSDSCIYTIADHLAGIANSKQTNLSSIADITAFDMSSRVRTVKAGQFLILKNQAGYYAVVSVDKIDNQRSTVTISFNIVREKLNSTWTYDAAKYLARSQQGRANFNYNDNSGKFTLGQGKGEFLLFWGGGGYRQARLYNDYLSSIALVPPNLTLATVADAAKLPPAGRTLDLSAGQSAVIQNRNGKYALITVVSAQTEGYSSEVDEVVFTYEILSD